MKIEAEEDEDGEEVWAQRQELVCSRKAFLEWAGLNGPHQSPAREHLGFRCARLSPQVITAAHRLSGRLESSPNHRERSGVAPALLATPIGSGAGDGDSPVWSLASP